MMLFISNKLVKPAKISKIQLNGNAFTVINIMLIEKLGKHFCYEK